jgi:hypothetical protein
LYSERPFDFAIRLHAACGLADDKGIYIVGGKYKDWTDKAFFYDINLAGTEAD